MRRAKSILIVDDDRQVLRYLRKGLEQNGYSVRSTASGAEAVAMIERAMPDLLILDLNMPEPDGFEVLRRERAKFPYLRILAISGYMGGALLGAARVLGAVATLEKPVTIEALTGKVRPGRATATIVAVFRRTLVET